MRWTLAELRKATGAELIEPPGPGIPEVVVTGVSTDSRAIAPGELFVAIRAERDGHDFVGSAAAAGAAAVLVERPVQVGTERSPSVPTLLVPSSPRALLDLGSSARQRLDGPVVAITGSVGKTSTKDLAAAALGAARRTVASERSFNNEIGLPLTLVNASADCQAAVLEMGARGPGHVALLCQVARPTIGVVTAVAAAHTEMFGDLDGIARAKGELVEALPTNGLAVLNGDDHRVRAMARRGPAPAVLYSQGEAAASGADVAADGITLDEDLRPTFRFHSPWGTVSVTLEARGAHQVGNALAALTVAAHIGVDLEAAAAALRTARLSPWRMELRRTGTGAAVLNDAYNANPASTRAALKALTAIPAHRRVAVLGLMAELGDRRVEEHRAVADLAAQLGISVVPVGTADYGVDPVGSLDEVIDRLGPLGESDAVLIKGSRVAGLERLADRLLGGT